MKNKLTNKSKKTRIIILFLGIVLAAMGIMQGDYRDTLLKAIMVCMECIGIG